MPSQLTLTLSSGARTEAVLSRSRSRSRRGVFFLRVKRQPCAEATSSPRNASPTSVSVTSGTRALLYPWILTNHPLFFIQSSEHLTLLLHHKVSPFLLLKESPFIPGDLTPTSYATLRAIQDAATTSPLARAARTPSQARPSPDGGSTRPSLVVPERDPPGTVPREFTCQSSSTAFCPIFPSPFLLPTSPR